MAGRSHIDPGQKSDISEDEISVADFGKISVEEALKILQV
jgi:hypothetical protein